MKIMDRDVFDRENIFGLVQENSGSAQYFIGKSYVNPLTKPEESPAVLTNVTFESGCRNNWHIHHAKTGGGQLVFPYSHERPRNGEEQRMAGAGRGCRI